MAGLFDWLEQALGGVGDAATNPTTMGAMSSAGTPPVAPPQAPMPSAPDPSQGQQPPMQPPMPPGPAPQGPQMGPDSPQNPTGGAVPMPMPRPAGADAAAAAATTPPPVPIVPPGGGPDAAGAIKSYQGAGGTMMSPGGPDIQAAGQGPQARGILSRALGIDPNTERTLTGGLAAGLKAAGNSSGKSPFQALASGASATLEGGDKADDNTTAKQDKYLSKAIEAAKIGDSRSLNQARTQLALAQTKMTLEGKGGKDSVVNSDQQLYLRAQGATNQDANLKILKSQYDKIALERGASSPEAKAAMDSYQKTYDDTLNGHLGRLGLDPKAAAKLGKQPGMSQENPVPKTKMTSQADFDKLAPGMFFVNPKDGQVLMKPMKGVGGAAAAMGPNGTPAAGAPAPGGQNLPAGQGGTPAPTGQSLPPMPPKAPTSPVAASIPGMGADEDVDEKEPA